jgi:hypothetical protein
MDHHDWLRNTPPNTPTRSLVSLMRRKETGELIEALTEEEYNLTFLSLCRQSTQIVGWPFSGV